MGNCFGSKSLTEDELLISETSLKIDIQNEEQHEQESRKIKVLLLGTGESGKSTVMKQMRILFGDKYTQDELESFKLMIQQNCCEFIEVNLVHRC